MTKENFLIRLKDVFFSYDDSEVLKNISLKIEKGEFIAILGKNGSGKTTFLKLLNALLLPSSGDVLVNRCNTKIPENTYKIRSTAGLVLQNPDSQIINSIVEEDVAFGPENLGLSQEEIRKRVEESLKLVKMEKYEKSSIEELSGGQKQKIAIAGILAMEPKCLLLDEVTTMLDYESKKDILKILKDINKKNKTTVIMVTHDVEELVIANRVLIFGNGQILLDTKPKELFYNEEILKKFNIKKPKIVEFIEKLKDKGLKIDGKIIEEDECFDSLEKILKLKQKA